MNYASSIPAAVNSMMNAVLARSVLSVEIYIKNNIQAALLVMRLPAPYVMFSDKWPEEHLALWEQLIQVVTMHMFIVLYTKYMQNV